MTRPPRKAAAMAEHKFKIGQMVYYRPRSRLVDAPTHRTYQIIQRLPATDGEYQYRIKYTHDQHERIAMESELRSVTQE